MQGHQYQPNAWKLIKPTESSMVISNVIRDIVELINPPKDSKKEMINLSLGDPTVFKNLARHEVVTQAIREALEVPHLTDAYGPSTGHLKARQVIAHKYTSIQSPLDADDVILTSGCSGALDIVINVLVAPGENLLIPAPGFPLYKTILDHIGAEARSYRLDPETQWNVDLDHMESLIDEHTRGILVNNPSNPCGTVYTRDHLLAIVSIAERHQLPIIADEVYGELTYNGSSFIPLGSISQHVPILTCGGLAKEYILPGWRLGWIIIHDRNQIFSQVRIAITKMSTIILGPSTLVQSCIPSVLTTVPKSWHDNICDFLGQNTKLLYNQLLLIKGIVPIRQNGAIYIMCRIEVALLKDIANDIEFCNSLLQEEHLFILPGSIFEAPNYVRIVVTFPSSLLDEICTRINDFCQRHLK